MIPAPLFVDPAHEGGTDPVVVRRGDEWWQRCSVIQAALLRVVDGVLVCDRDEDVELDLGGT
ncbi:hypothetical protein [Cellulomonas sp. KRMCY2]|uniref:hypothetical protein n=1 Tax=Cellulomonas sp. KRMCY2 TaxID=1304865 RepID=UPI00045E8569|nr:hypothetical protein [Cellulomonas sp. KRMCY2]